MIRLVTQYSHLSAQGTPFPHNGIPAWDGGTRPDLFHIVGFNYKVNSYSKYVAQSRHTINRLSDWKGRHLNSFRLELVYE